MEKEKEEVLDEEKKSKNNGLGPGFMVILVVLFLIGIGLGFAAAKVIDLDVKEDSKEVEKDKKEEKKEKLSLDDSRFVDVYNNLKSYTYRQNRENASISTNCTKMPFLFCAKRKKRVTHRITRGLTIASILFLIFIVLVEQFLGSALKHCRAFR